MILSCKGLLFPFWANSIIALTAYLVLVESFIIYFPIIPTTIVAYYTNLSIISAKKKGKIMLKSENISKSLYISCLRRIPVGYLQKNQFYAGSILYSLDDYNSYH